MQSSFIEDKKAKYAFLKSKFQTFQLLNIQKNKAGFFATLSAA